MRIRQFGRVFQRKGRKGWYVRIREGRTEITEYGGPDRTAALRHLEAVRRDREEIRLYGRRKVEEIYFEDFLEIYFDQIEETHAPDTVKDYRWKARKFLKAFKGRHMDEILSQDVERFLNSLRGLVPATLNRYRSALSSIFKKALAQGFASRNPVAGIRLHREKKRPIPYLSLEEQDELVEACPEELRVYVRLAMETGLRRGELFRLEWRDVDLDRSVLTARETKGKAPRDVPITPFAGAVLAELWAGRTVPLKGPDRVLAWARVLRRQHYAAFHTAAAVIGHRDLRPHDLRHVFGCTAARAGVPLPDLQKIMGHATLAMTMRYAGHCPENVVDRVGDVLKSIRGTSRGTSAEAGTGSA